MNITYQVRHMSLKLNISNVISHTVICLYCYLLVLTAFNKFLRSLRHKASFISSAPFNKQVYRQVHHSAFSLFLVFFYKMINERMIYYLILLNKLHYIYWLNRYNVEIINRGFRSQRSRVRFGGQRPRQSVSDLSVFVIVNVLWDLKSTSKEKYQCGTMSV